MFDVPFEPYAELAAHRPAGNPTRIGAMASFVGFMRDLNEGDDVSSMTLEHYPGMTEKALERLRDEALERWQLADALVIHRVGELGPTDP
ncbi:MAG TPA: molybdenum cofactor biosynthesis protein MoaE, partial [Gammaproteobacteria bacterium]